LMLQEALSSFQWYQSLKSTLIRKVPQLVNSFSTGTMTINIQTNWSNSIYLIADDWEMIKIIFSSNWDVISAIRIDKNWINTPLKSSTPSVPPTPKIQQPNKPSDRVPYKPKDSVLDKEIDSNTNTWGVVIPNKNEYIKDLRKVISAPVVQPQIPTEPNLQLSDETEVAPWWWELSVIRNLLLWLHSNEIDYIADQWKIFNDKNSITLQKNEKIWWVRNWSKITILYRWREATIDLNDSKVKEYQPSLDTFDWVQNPLASPKRMLWYLWNWITFYSILKNNWYNSQFISYLYNDVFKAANFEDHPWDVTVHNENDHIIFTLPWQQSYENNWKKSHIWDVEIIVDSNWVAYAYLK
jgi:hypothetical protein